MARVRFESDSTHLELHGSEAFVWRQLQLLAAFLGDVDVDLLEETTEAIQDRPPADTVGEAEPAPARPGEEGASVIWEETADRAAEVPEEVAEPPQEVPAEALGAFFESVPPEEGEAQVDAALLFSYFLQQSEGRQGVTLSDLLRCCIRVGVDSRNFHEALGVLKQRGHLEQVRPGGVYRLSSAGIAAVEERLA
jgi:hypothetical protein